MQKSNCDAFVSRVNFTKEFKCKDTLLLNVTADYLDICIPSSKAAENKINNFIKNQLKNYYARTNKLLCEAKEAHKYAVENGYPFNAYEAYLQYTCTFASCSLLSFYYDEYVYTGGAHGTTTRNASTFDTCTGRLLPLSHFFDERDYVQYILNLIILQADENMQENPGIYFENYRQLIKDNFNPQSFYLTKEGINIYFGQYDIAPYSTGIVVFTIPHQFIC